MGLAGGQVGGDPVPGIPPDALRPIAVQVVDRHIDGSGFAGDLQLAGAQIHRRRLQRHRGSSQIRLEIVDGDALVLAAERSGKLDRGQLQRLGIEFRQCQHAVIAGNPQAGVQRSEAAVQPDLGAAAQHHAQRRQPAQFRRAVRQFGRSDIVEPGLHPGDAVAAAEGQVGVQPRDPLADRQIQPCEAAQAALVPAKRHVGAGSPPDLMRHLIVQRQPRAIDPHFGQPRQRAGLAAGR